MWVSPKLRLQIALAPNIVPTAPALKRPYGFIIEKVCDTTDEEQQLRELDTSRQRARRVFEDNEDGSRASAEATEEFFGLGVRRLELIKIIEKR